MEINVGDYFEGKDCCNEYISGTISKILENVVIVECPVKYHVVKKSEAEKAGQTFEKLKKKNEFNRTLL